MRFPDPLVEERHRVLARFGYDAEAAPTPVAEPDDRQWAEMWEPLKPDFAIARRPQVPAYASLTPAAQAAARLYMRCRLEADRLLEACKGAHTRLARDGITTEAVERYAVVRDAYEDSVAAFGSARARVDEILPTPAE
jgi:hypothetical protein